MAPRHIHRQQQGILSRVAAVDLRVQRNSDRRDRDVRTLDAVLGRGGHPRPAIPRRGQRTLGDPVDIVVHHDFLDLGQLGERDLEVTATLHSTANDCEATLTHGHMPHGQPRHARGAHLGDPATVEQRNRAAGLGVIHDDRAIDIGQPLGVVLLIPGNPLDADGVDAAEVGRHRVDEGVITQGDSGLGRVLHQVVRLLLEGTFQAVHDLGPGQTQALEVGAVEDEQFVVGHARHATRVRSGQQQVAYPTTRTDHSDHRQNEQVCRVPKRRQPRPPPGAARAPA